jgi:membrane fusion protein (multidrug efflux system)
MNKKLVIRMAIMLGVVILVLGGIVGWNTAKAIFGKQAMAQMKPPPQTVSTLKVAFEEWQPSISAVGTLRAVRGVDMALEVSGLVSEVNLKPGSEVKAGDVLLKMRSEDVQAQLQSLQASQQLAEVNFKRSGEQLEAKAISLAQHDSDEANLKSARAAVAAQEALLAKKTLRAPFAGRVGITKVAAGQYLNPGDVVATLQQLDPIYMDFSVPQREMSQLTAGRPVNVSLDSFPGKTFKGTITTINPKVDANTRNVQVEATLRNPGNVLTPGMFGNVTVDVGAKQRYLTLPQTAITYNPYGETVYVVKAGEAKPAGGQTGANQQNAGKAPQGQPQPAGNAQQTFVTTGPTRGDQVAIIKGLQEGDEVVTSGQSKLKNNTPVVINNTVQPANDPNPHPQEQ